MSQHDEDYDVGYRAAERAYCVTEVRTALIDASVMLLEIERNRQLPPSADTLQQYIKLGDEIRKLIAKLPNKDF